MKIIHKTPSVSVLYDNGKYKIEYNKDHISKFNNEIYGKLVLLIGENEADILYDYSTKRVLDKVLYKASIKVPVEDIIDNNSELMDSYLISYLQEQETNVINCYT